MSQINFSIYMLKSKNSPKFYIGGTRRSLACRLSQHKYDYNKHLNGTRFYVTSFEVIKHGDVEIIELEKRINSTTLDKTKLERYYVEKFRDDVNLVNKYMPGRTKREYYEENKKMLMEKHKIYNEENKDKIRDINRKHYMRRKIEKKIEKTLEKLVGNPLYWPTIL